MALSIVVADRRSHVRTAWEEAFGGVQNLRTADLAPAALLASAGLDAALLPYYSAYERFGGRPRVGGAEIVSTRGDTRMPPWVLAQPPFPVGSDLSWEERTYQAFRTIFQAIQEFNRGHPGGELRVLGFSCELEWAGDEAAAAAAPVVHRAYTDAEQGSP